MSDAAPIKHIDRSAPITHGVAAQAQTALATTLQGQAMLAASDNAIATEAQAVSGIGALSAQEDVITYGPGAENLQLLLDWEDYTAGTDLTNVYPDNSGIQSLTANNNPGVEAQNPLVGQQSGDYNRASSEWHGGTKYSALDMGGVGFYWSTFFQAPSIGTANQALFSTDNGTSYGVLIRLDAGDTPVFRVANGGGFDSVSLPIISAGNTYFWECWYTDTDNTIHTRINDGSKSTANSTAASGSDPVSVASRGERTHYNGLMDNVIVEIAPQGELFWPDHSSWLYNSGAGRSSDEILQYSP